LKKQQKWQTYYFRFIYHKKHVSTVASGVDNSNSMDVVIAKKKKRKEKKRLAKLKIRKGGLGKNERPSGLKTRKGDPGKNKGHAKENIYSR